MEFIKALFATVIIAALSTGVVDFSSLVLDASFAMVTLAFRILFVIFA